MRRSPLRASRVVVASSTLLVCLAAFLPACKSADAKVWNLRQVHEGDGSTSRVGRVRNDLQHRMIEGTRFAGYEGTNIFGLDDGGEKPIEDPDRVNLENLVGLAEFDADDPRIRALQVEMFGWLAVDDPYVLARERCCLELGPLGRQLGVTTPVRRDEDTPAAGPAEVRAVLEELAGVLAPAAKLGLDVSNANLDAACEKIEGLELDRDGMRRLVGTITTLLYEGKADPARLGRLLDVHEGLQKSFIAQSLAYALEDPAPLVRAAAIEASVVASDNAIPGLLRGALYRDPSETVVIRVLELLERHGFPQLPRDTAPEEQEGYERAWIAEIVNLLRNPFEGPSSIAACQALGAISGADFESLHPEAWIAWWEERLAAAESASS